jgi:hypothetical protein
MDARAAFGVTGGALRAGGDEWREFSREAFGGFARVRFDGEAEDSLAKIIDMLFSILCTNDRGVASAEAFDHAIANVVTGFANALEYELANAAGFCC